MEHKLKKLNTQKAEIAANIVRAANNVYLAEEAVKKANLVLKEARGMLRLYRDLDARNVAEQVCVRQHT